MVWDNALTQTQCDDVIALFERSEHFEGNLMKDGKIHVAYDVKKASEYVPTWMAGLSRMYIGFHSCLSFYPDTILVAAPFKVTRNGQPSIV